MKLQFRLLRERLRVREGKRARGSVALLSVLFKTAREDEESCIRNELPTELTGEC